MPEFLPHQVDFLTNESTLNFTVESGHLILPGKNSRVHWTFKSNCTGVLIEMWYVTCKILVKELTILLPNSRKVVHTRSYVRKSAVEPSSNIGVLKSILSSPVNYALQRTIFMLVLIIEAFSVLKLSTSPLQVQKISLLIFFFFK